MNKQRVGFGKLTGGKDIELEILLIIDCLLIAIFGYKNNHDGGANMKSMTNGML
jgi:hypothetical protein